MEDQDSGYCDDVSSVSSMSATMLTYGGLNDLCVDAADLGEGGPGFVDHCDDETPSPPCGGLNWPCDVASASA